MRRRWLAGLVVAVFLFGSTGASADPSNWAQLAQIILTLQRIDAVLSDVNDLISRTKEKLFLVYPEAAVRRIETVFEPVDSVKREVEKLACDWRFTPRVNRLRVALFGGGSFCRSDWNLVFGPPVAGAGWDLESYYDWSAVRRLNLIKTRNEKSSLRAEEAAWLASEAIAGRDPWDPTKPYSPGYAQRLSALGAAELGNVMVEMGDTQTAMLDLDQEALNDKRRKRLLDHEAATLVYAGLTTLRNDVATDTTLFFFGDHP
jgi:hypothetical protein